MVRISYQKSPHDKDDFDSKNEKLCRLQRENCLNSLKPKRKLFSKAFFRNSSCETIQHHILFPKKHRKRSTFILATPMVKVTQGHISIFFTLILKYPARSNTDLSRNRQKETNIGVTFLGKLSFVSHRNPRILTWKTTEITEICVDFMVFIDFSVFMDFAVFAVFADFVDFMNFCG